MTYELYTFLLCLIVFILFVATFCFLIATVVKLSVRLIRTGDKDTEIEAEYAKAQKKSRWIKIVDRVVSALILFVLCVALAFSIYVNAQEDHYFENIPTLKVVQSSSMQHRNEKNEYLFENKLCDQIDMFDLILTHKIPAEDELELYNIVVYEVYDELVIHRIVGIEEPNDKHPNERYFLCQGDSLSQPDIFPVLYSQMRGIYYGERVPMIGSFIMFMHSPAGWLCVMLVAAAMIATPILERCISKEEQERLELMRQRKQAENEE